jgi:glycosyltransferase involved in cell wall biosynthesis
VEVLTTRASRLRHTEHFAITWPNELPRHDEHEGVPIRRFDAVNVRRVASGASDAVLRRWSQEDFTGGALVPGSSRFVETAVSRARARPRRHDLLADLGRGPLVPRLVAHIRRHAAQYDVILAGYAPFSLPRQVLWAASRVGVPVVLLPFIHEGDRYHQFSSLLRTYEQAAAVFTLSEHTSEFLRTYVPHSKPVTLGAGFTVPSASSVSVEAFRARHDLGQRRIVLYVGRKEHGKRYDLAVKAVEMLPEDVLLLMVGRDVDGKKIGSDRVRVLGLLSDDELAAAYEACEVFLLPSMFESFGMVFLDAWLRGKPVIGNASCGASAALIEDGHDGFLCRDAGGIASVLCRLLEDPGLAARVGARGRAKTLAEYTWDRVADRALTALQEVAQRTPSVAGASS